MGRSCVCLSARASGMLTRRRWSHPGLKTQAAAAPTSGLLSSRRRTAHCGACTCARSAAVLNPCSTCYC
eukprot:311589-Rhodomonas_salina.2